MSEISGVYFTMITSMRDPLWFDRVDTLDQCLGVWYHIVKLYF